MTLLDALTLSAEATLETDEALLDIQDEWDEAEADATEASEEPCHCECRLWSAGEREREWE